MLIFLSFSIATLSSLNDSSSEDEDEKGQAFYAGGSERSGQQVLGPPKKNPIKDYVSEIFRSAQQGHMETFDGDSSPSSSSSLYAGMGYRLGQTDTDHQAVPDRNRPSGSAGGAGSGHNHEVVTLTLWRQGFSINDAEHLEDSESKAGTGNRQKCDDLWDAVRIIQETQQQILLMQCQNPPPLAPPAGSQVSNSELQSVAEAQKKCNKPAGEKVQAFYTSAVVSCAKCSKDHQTYHCEQFKVMDVSGRRGLARSQGLCFNCSMPSHTVNKCSLKPSCLWAGCEQRHHALLCLQQQQSQESGETRNQSPQQLEQTEEVSVNAAQANAIKHDPSSVALLPTIREGK